MKRKNGSILIFTLWVLVILIVLSVMLSHRAATDVNLARRESNSTKAAYLAKAGVMKMLMELAGDTNTFDSLYEDWNRDERDPKKFNVAKDTVLYGAHDETGRLNLNGKLTRDNLVSLGLDWSLADATLSYREKKDNKTFEFIEELFLVEGMTNEIFSDIKDMVTIYRGTDEKININTASERVLQVVTGDSFITGQILDYRSGPDAKQGTDDDQAFEDMADINMIAGIDPSSFTVKSDVFRIWARPVLSNNERVFKSVEAVVDRKTGKVYHWKEY